MAHVTLTRHLVGFFPVLGAESLEVAATTAAEVVRALDALAPGVGSYLVDERGRLREHVNLFVDGSMVRDRVGLSDAVGADAEVHVIQALSGG